MQNEAYLIKRAQNGDENAFANLYRCYRERIYRYFFSRVGDQTNAEELTSQTFLAVLERLPQYRHMGKFTAWLFGIARNKAMDFFRQQRQISGSLDGDYIVVMYDPQFIDDIIDLEHAEALSGLIRQMPPDKKELLRLRFAVGLTYKEIAEISGRRTSAVKKSIYRILDGMKHALENDNE